MSHFDSNPLSPMASTSSRDPSGNPAASASAASASAASASAASASSDELAAPAGFVKLAMRNMVRKGRQSLFHFGLTAVGLVAFLLLIAWLGRPAMPQ
jgi:hypothetical protein